MNERLRTSPAPGRISTKAPNSAMRTTVPSSWTSIMTSVYPPMPRILLVGTVTVQMRGAKMAVAGSGPSVDVAPLRPSD